MRSGIPYVIGSQVGETSLLTRVALALPVCEGTGFTREGAFGTHLLQEDLSDPSVMFGARGLLFPDQKPYCFQKKSGWGLTLKPLDHLLTQLSPQEMARAQGLKITSAQ